MLPDASDTPAGGPFPVPPCSASVHRPVQHPYSFAAAPLFRFRGGSVGPQGPQWEALVEVMSQEVNDQGRLLGTRCFFLFFPLRTVARRPTEQSANRDPPHSESPTRCIAQSTLQRASPLHLGQGTVPDHPLTIVIRPLAPQTGGRSTALRCIGLFVH